MGMMLLFWNLPDSLSLRNGLVMFFINLPLSYPSKRRVAVMA